MAMSAAVMPQVQDLYRLSESSYTAAYVVSQRDVVGKRFNEWKKEIRKSRDVFSGDWSRVYGPGPEDALIFDASLKVQNLTRDAVLDSGRLVAESMAATRVEVIGVKRKERDDAVLRAAIAQGYHIATDGEELSELYGQDLALAGGSFQLHYIDRNADGELLSDYPCHARLDPIGVFPTILDTKLLSVIYLRHLNAQQADRTWPELGIKSMTDPSADVEVIEYLATDELVKVVRIGANRINGQFAKKDQKSYIVEAYRNPLGQVPVSFGKLAEQDSGWRGLFNQTSNVTNTMNRLMTLVIDNLERAVYAPMVSKGLMNPEDTGPDASLELDRNVQDARAERLNPAPLQGGLFQLMGMLDNSARGGANYPPGRGGQADQSIISGAGVASLQGGQITMVRSLQRAAGAMRRKGNELDFALDEEYLNFEKDLLVPAGELLTYVPRDAIAGQHRTKVVFGMGAGLDPYNRGQFVMMAKGNELISQLTAMGLMPDNDNPEGEMRQLYLEKSMAILFQRLNAAQTPEAGVAFAEALDSGKGDVLKALISGLTAEVAAQQQQMMMQQQMAAQGPPGQPAAPLPGPRQPAEVAAQATSISKGGQPGAPANPETDFEQMLANLPAAAPSYAPPPMTTNVVR